LSRALSSGELDQKSQIIRILLSMRSYRQYLRVVRDQKLAKVAAKRGLRTVPSNIIRPPYANSGIVAPSPPYVVVQQERDVDGLRRAGQLARKFLELACSLAEVGRSTDDIDAEVHDAICAMGVYPAPLNYKHFPKSLCAAVNHEVCHGIPNARKLESGDICKFDVSVFTEEGYFGDNCATVLVGDVDAEGQRLARATREATRNAIAVCKPGACLSSIGAEIQAVCDEHGFSSVENFCGHGIGRQFHMAPFVQHFKNDDVLTLKPGMVFTIEPMICEGSKEIHVSEADGWTVLTTDGRRAAQYEHTVAITEDGHEVLTAGDLTALEF